MLSSKLWNSGRISISIGISIFFFPTLQFLPYFCQHRNFDLILLKVGTLGFLIYWLSDLILPNMGIVARFIKTGILILFFKTFEFWCFFCKRWNSDLILSNFSILALFSFGSLHHRVLTVLFKCVAIIRLRSYVSCPKRSYTLVFCFVPFFRL